MVEIAMHGVILKKVSEGPRVRQVIDRNEVDVRVA